MVALLVRMNKQYENEREELEEDLETFRHTDVNESLQRASAVLVVDQVDAQDDPRAAVREDAALRRHRRASGGRPDGHDARAGGVEPGGPGRHPAARAARLGRRGRAHGRVHRRPALRSGRDRADPGLPQVSKLERLFETRDGTKLTRALLPYPNVRVTLVRDHPDGVHPLTVRRATAGRWSALRPAAPTRPSCWSTSWTSRCCAPRATRGGWAPPRSARCTRPSTPIARRPWPTSGWPTASRCHSTSWSAGTATSPARWSRRCCT